MFVSKQECRSAAPAFLIFLPQTTRRQPWLTVLSAQIPAPSATAKALSIVKAGLAQAVSLSDYVRASLALIPIRKAAISTGTLSHGAALTGPNARFRIP
jgi:hypothetical protein